MQIGPRPPALHEMVTNWKQIATDKKRLGKKSHSQVLAVCSKNPEAVLAILNEKNISQYLSWEQFLEILGCNPALSREILGDQELEFYKDLSAEDLVTLGKMHPETAKYILDNPLLCNKLTTTKIFLSLGKSHPKVANHLLKTKELFEKAKIGKNELIELGKQFSDTALYILNEESLSQKLETREKISLGKELPKVARYIVDDNTLSKQLDNNAVSDFAKSLPENAEHIIKRFDLIGNLSSYDLKKFGEYCANIPFMAFDNSELSCKFSVNLEDLSKKRAFITRVLNHVKKAKLTEKSKLADLILKEGLFEKSQYLELKNACLADPQEVLLLLNDEDLRKNLLTKLSWQQFLEIIGCHSKLFPAVIAEEAQPGFVPLHQLLTSDDLATLGKMRQEIAVSIIKNAELRKKLGRNEWISYGEKFKTIALHIIEKKPDPLKELTKSELHKLAQAHVEVADHIIKTPELCNKLEKRDWLELIKNCHKIAKLIFAKPAIYTKFEPNDWRTLARHCQKIAVQIATREELKHNLNKDDLCNLGKRFSDVGRHLLSTATLAKDLEGKDLYGLSEAFPPIVGLISNNAGLKNRLNRFGSFQTLQFKKSFIKEVSARARM